MEAKELMIGNYLRYKQDFPDTHLQGKVVKVYSIRGRLLDVVTIDDDTIHESQHLDWLEPIPITVEILKKNGFEERDDLVICDDDFLPYVIDKIGTKENYEIIVTWRDSYDNGAADGFNRESWCESWNLYCRNSTSNFDLSNKKKIYVHQLQNALRICGIDKEIEL